MKFILGYVNTPTTEDYLDRHFDTMILLMAFVNQEYKNWTSYNITVVAQ